MDEGSLGAEGPLVRVQAGGGGGGRGVAGCPPVAPESRRPDQLDEEERARLRRAHFRLRNASQALEALTASSKQKGRWDPRPPTDEALDAARAELRTAYEAVWRLEAELFG